MRHASLAQRLLFIARRQPVIPRLAPVCRTLGKPLKSLAWDLFESLLQSSPAPFAAALDCGSGSQLLALALGEVEPEFRGRSAMGWRRDEQKQTKKSEQLGFHLDSVRIFSRRWVQRSFDSALRTAMA